MDDRPRCETQATPDEAITSMYWWAFPSRIVLFVHFPLFFLCAYLGESAYAVYKHNAKFFSGEIVIVGAIALAMFALASMVFEPTRAQTKPETRIDVCAVNRAINVLFALVLGAYAIFMFPLLFKPQLLIDLMQGSTTAMYDLRSTLNRIPGVTSFVAVESLLAVIILNYGLLTGAALPTHYRNLFFVVMFACVMRAWLWSERLAAIELALAMVVTLYAKANVEKSTKTIDLKTFAPLLGLVGLLAVFSVGEYFRSWQYYQNVFPGSFFEFIVIRFSGYYATALNNGALLVENGPLYEPVMTAHWYHSFPLWQFIDPTRPAEGFDVMAYLEAYLNPEFNNTSGILMPLFDYGYFLGVLVCAGLGAISGRLFAGFARGELLGLLFYPLWFTGVVELLRVFYWGHSRFFPVILATLAVVAYFRAHAVDRPLPRQQLALPSVSRT